MKIQENLILDIKSIIQFFLFSGKISLVRLTVCHSGEKREILSHQKIFRQINSLVTYLSSKMLM